MTSIEAVGFRILLKPHFEEDIIKDGALKGFKMDVGEDFKREKAGTVVGDVLGIGKFCWYAYDRYLPNGEVNPEWEPWCKEGDIVYFAKHGGKFVTDVEGDTFLLINDADVQGIYIHKEDR